MMQGTHIYQSKPLVHVDIETLIPKNHILRKLNKVLNLAFVRKLTEDCYHRNHGRPSIDPELFFRMILIGYIFGIRHDRKLCEEITYNLAYRWYCKLSLADIVPDHSTLSKIRDRYGLKIFEDFFSKVLDLCNKAGLIKGEKIITDSILIDADASLDSMVIKESVAKSESVDNTTKQFKPYKRLSNQTHVSTTDPDSSLARKPGSYKGLKYKVHTSIDGHSRVILDNKVTTGSCHDTQVYLERLQYIQDKYNIVITEVIADRSYGAADNIQFLQKQNITSYIPLFSNKSGQIAKLEKQGFIFDQNHNRYVCPQDKLLLPYKREGATVYKSKATDCKDCPISKDCPASIRKCSQYVRHIYRSHNQLFYETQQQRMKTSIFLEKLKERMWKIEGINAEAKNLHALKRARYRSLSKVQIQAYMTGAVQNLKRLIQATLLKYFSIFIYIAIFIKNSLTLIKRSL